MSKQHAGGTHDLSNSNNREWWTLLFQGFVNCTIARASGLGNNSPLVGMKQMPIFGKMIKIVIIMTQLIVSILKDMI